MRSFIFVLFFIGSGFAHAEVIYNDPSQRTLQESYRNFDIKSLKCKSESDPKSAYLLGVLYQNGNYSFEVEKNTRKAISLFKYAWEGEVWDAGYSLFWMYYQGEGVKKNIKLARGYLKNSAKNGYILSQKELAKIYGGYDLNDVFAENSQERIFWLQKAAENGDGDSAVELSAIYLNGEDIGKNKALAFSWLKKGENAKYPPPLGSTHYFLAQHYENGVGTNKNLTKAYKYYDLSGTAGAEDKQRIAKDMTREQIDEAIRESKAWQKENNVEIGGGFIQRAN